MCPLTARTPLGPVAYGRTLGWMMSVYHRAPNHPAKLRILQRLESWLGPKRIICPVAGGFEMALDRLDLIQRTLFEEREWEPGLSSLLRQELLPDDVFGDAGANVGYFSLLALGCGVDRVVCFEPDPATASVLRLNLAINGWESRRVIVLEKALGASVGTALFGRSPATNTGMSGLKNPNAQSSFQVPVTTLDEAFAGLPGFWPTVLKIDVEGLEEDVFAGASRLLSKCPPRLIVFEADGDGKLLPCSQNLRTLLARYGYSLSVISGEIHGEGKANFVARKCA